MVTIYKLIVLLLVLQLDHLHRSVVLMEDLKLYGFWASPFSARVIWALKLKGIDYEYVEEDVISNKSQQLLLYNPIYKKIPVLVHGGKPIAESTVILEYIEDTWPQNHPLLPKDPYHRAVARFFIRFGEDKLPSFGKFFKATGKEEIENAAKELREVLKVLEEQLGVVDGNFFGGDAINLVDIVNGSMALWFEAIEQVVGLKLVDSTSFPRLHAWTLNFKQLPLVSQNLPDASQLLAHLTSVRG